MHHGSVVFTDLQIAVQIYRSLYRFTDLQIAVQIYRYSDL